MPVSVFSTIINIWKRKSLIAIMSVIFTNLLITNLDVKSHWPNKKNDETITNDYHEKHEIFNIYYSSVWTDDNGLLIHFPRRFPFDPNIADIVFTSSNVLKQLKNLRLILLLGLMEFTIFFFIRILLTVWRIR